MIRAIVTGALLAAIAIVLTIRLLPSFATIDVTAKTDVVSFETAPTIVSNELHFGVTNAAVCSYAVDEALSIGAPAHSCEALGRQAVEASYNGDVLLVGAVRVSLQRSQAQLELVAVPLAADASVTIGGHPIPDGAFLTMTATTASPRLLSFGALVRSVVLGQSGIDRSRPASLLLEGTLHALATDGLNNTVLQGPKVSLGRRKRSFVNDSLGPEPASAVRCRARDYFEDKRASVPQPRSSARSLNALPMTETEDRLMAAAAIIGDSSVPKTG